MFIFTYNNNNNYYITQNARAAGAQGGGGRPPFRPPLNPPLGAWRTGTHADGSPVSMRKNQKSIFRRLAAMHDRHRRTTDRLTDGRHQCSIEPKIDSHNFQEDFPFGYAVMHYKDWLSLNCIAKSTGYATFSESSFEYVLWLIKRLNFINSNVALTSRFFCL